MHTANIMEAQLGVSYQIRAGQVRTFSSTSTSTSTDPPEYEYHENRTRTCPALYQIYRVEVRTDPRLTTSVSLQGCRVRVKLSKSHLLYISNCAAHGRLSCVVQSEEYR